jgi:hypothetical protein
LETVFWKESADYIDRRKERIMTANKTVETNDDVNAFITGIADAGQRADSALLCTLLSKLTGHPPKLWGPSIIGFGSYHYVYESGREGDSLRIGFSPRKGQTALYGWSSQFDDHVAMAKLGKHKTGKGCLYVKRLSDVDMAVLEAMAAKSYAEMAKRYPE